MYLEKIKKANDIKKIEPENYAKLAEEIRKFLIENVSKTGGHIASNLGVVELTMALHLALDLEKDKIVFDVGHQAYVHKILTGRWTEFDTLRQTGGLSGFPKQRESKYDAFNTGHSSTSISVALGLAAAAYDKNEDKTIACVIGDGAMTGGLAFEAINNASKLKRNLIIILNDNEMSISQNIGGFSTYLSTVRAGEKYQDMKAGVIKSLEKNKRGEVIESKLRKTKRRIKKIFVPGTYFEDMGITYLGPFDGHDIEMMTRIINEAKAINRPTLIHVVTKKGKGYKHAEENPAKFHGIGPFDVETGDLKAKSKNPTYTKVFSKALIDEAKKNENIIAITAAMPDGTGLTNFQKEFPERFYDVGIAEEHAVTFAAGLAAGGMKPFVCIYSTFLQRAYDEVLHDVCIQSLPVTFCLDRGGLVGADGETHQGIYDISYLSTIPGMSIFAPKNARELEEAISFAAGHNGPLAIRYPRGEAFTGLSEFDAPIVFGKSEYLFLEDDIAIIAVGSMVETAFEVRKELKEKGKNVSLVNARFVQPLDEEMILEIAKHHKTIITMEENVITGGFGMAVLRYVNNNHIDIKVITIAIPNAFIEQGSVSDQKKECGIDKESILKRLEKEFE